jgi:hypothetical protein
MRTKIFFITLFLMIILSSSMVSAQLATTVITDKTSVKPGAIINTTLEFKNNFNTIPLILAVNATYQDSLGAFLTSTASSGTITINHPLTITASTLPLNALDYVPNSASVNGIPIAATIVSNTLTLPINVTVNDQQIIDVLLQLKTK